jgi:hypothetical protein
LLAKTSKTTAQHGDGEGELEEEVVIPLCPPPPKLKAHVLREGGMAIDWCENIKDAAERTNSDADNFINKIITNNESKIIQHFKDLSGESSNTYPSSSSTSQPLSENKSATENLAFGRSAYIQDDCCVVNCCVPFPNIQGMSPNLLSVTYISAFWHLKCKGPHTTMLLCTLSFEPCLSCCRIENHTSRDWLCHKPSILGGAMPNRPKNKNCPITMKIGDIVGFAFIKK